MYRARRPSRYSRVSRPGRSTKAWRVRGRARLRTNWSSSTSDTIVPTDTVATVAARLVRREAGGVRHGTGAGRARGAVRARDASWEPRAWWGCAPAGGLRQTRVT